MSSSRLSAAWYLLAVLPLALGVTLAVVFGKRMYDETVHMQRVVVPGSGEVVLESGSYVGYGETQSVVDGRSYSTPALAVRCTMVEAATGAPVALTSSSTTSNYTMGGFSGRSMFQLEIARAGTYRLSCDGDSSPATIAIGSGIGGAVVRMIGSVFGGIIGAIALIVGVRRRRRRAPTTPG